MSEAVTKNTVWNLITELSNKKGITDIIINNHKTIFVEREGQLIQLNVILTQPDIEDFIHEVALYNKKECHQDNPIMDGNLPDGSRINVILGPFAKGSPAVTIRKYLPYIRDFDSDPHLFALNTQWVEYFKAAVKARLNIIVAGGTGAGKTTFMNLMLNELNSNERVITIEDTIELQIKIPNTVRLESGGQNLASKVQLTSRDLVKNTLRMRPDRIIIGEVRGGEMFDLLQAMNTGHEGSMTSVHANSPGECLSRMETLYLIAGFDVPYHVVRKQMSQAIDVIVQISRARSGKRVVSHLSEITGMEGDVISMQTIATYNEDKDALVFTGIPSSRIKQLHDRAGLPIDFFNNIIR